MWSNVAAIPATVVLLGLGSLFLRAAPATQALVPDASACGTVAPEHVCITLMVRVDERLRLERPLRGTLNWALYRAGDVGILGPGKHDPVAAGAQENVELDGPDAVAALTIADVPHGAYQALLYLDVDLDDEASDGDPVTLPARAFDASAGGHLGVSVYLDHLL